MGTWASRLGAPAPPRTRRPAPRHLPFPLGRRQRAGRSPGRGNPAPRPYPTAPHHIAPHSPVRSAGGGTGRACGPGRSPSRRSQPGRNPAASPNRRHGRGEAVGGGRGGGGEGRGEGGASCGAGQSGAEGPDPPPSPRQGRPHLPGAAPECGAGASLLSERAGQPGGKAPGGDNAVWIRRGQGSLPGGVFERSGFKNNVSRRGFVRLGTGVGTEGSSCVQLRPAAVQ